MPHYKDGTPAEIGDLVKGKPYNTNREIVGEVIQITEGTDSCNCVVAFVAPQVTPIPVHDFYSHNLPIPPHFRRPIGGRVQQGLSYDTENVLLVPKSDYGALKDFVKVG